MWRLARPAPASALWAFPSPVARSSAQHIFAERSANLGLTVLQASKSETLLRSHPDTVTGIDCSFTPLATQFWHKQTSRRLVAALLSQLHTPLPGQKSPQAPWKSDFLGDRNIAQHSTKAMLLSSPVTPYCTTNRQILCNNDAQGTNYGANGWKW